MRRHLAVVCALVLLAPWGAHAETQRVASCYAAIPELGVKPLPSRRQLTLLFDRTVLFDDTVKSDLSQRVSAFMTAGDRVVIAQFSSYGQGDYAQVVFDGRLDVPLSANKRYWISKFALQKFDRCLSEQASYMQVLVPRTVAAVMARANAQYVHTDIIGTLNQLAPQITAEPGAEHDLVIVSDMLENSDMVSFYHKNDLRLLDPKAELEKVRRVQFLSNLAGTRVYAEGPAFSLSQGDVPDRNFRALKEFWVSYFAASNAELVDFGSPLLHAPLR